MKHHDANRKFGRSRDGRRALMKGLAVSLIRDEKITTTEAKAKELRPMIEKLVTRARMSGIVSRRLLVARLGSEQSAEKLVKEIAPRYTDREGGYTRIVKLAPRASDASPMAVIEFV
ncbi:MAG: 50S ribosomal protein L17 [Candidatus Yonathbacteria bacterium]|nr:50S ribosomal protein L17 [Candidatus Yonathbacteria bacterium]